MVTIVIINIHDSHTCSIPMLNFFFFSSRNQLTTLPREVCRLPLQTLLVAYNRIISLPDELGRMSVLVEFDAGCNKIRNLPSSLKDLMRLKYLDLRSNLLMYIPTGTDISYSVNYKQFSKKIKKLSFYRTYTPEAY